MDGDSGVAGTSVWRPGPSEAEGGSGADGADGIDGAPGAAGLTGSFGPESPAAQATGAEKDSTAAGTRVQIHRLAALLRMVVPP